MKKTTLSMLNKSELIEIILSDRMWERKAYLKVLYIVHKRIDSIIDEQEKCDLSSEQGRKRYFELEEGYERWSKIQANL